MSMLSKSLRTHALRWDKSWQYMDGLEAEDTGVLAHHILQKLLRPETPQQHLEKLIFAQRWEEAERALRHPTFSGLAPEMRGRIKKEQLVQQNHQHFQAVLQKLSDIPAHDTRTGPSFMPLFPFHDSPERVLRWLSQSNHRGDAPQGFFPTWSLEPTDADGHKLVRVLQEVVSSQALEEHALELTNALLRILQPNSSRHIPIVEYDKGFVRAHLRGYTLEQVLGLRAHASGAGSWLYIPLSSEIEWPEVPSQCLYFNPLSCKTPAPRGSLELRLEVLLASLHHPTQRADWIQRELVRQVSLQGILSSDWIEAKAATRSNPSDIPGLGQEVYILAHRFGVNFDEAKGEVHPLQVLLFLTGSIPRLCFSLFKQVLESLSQQKGRRYGPITSQDIERCWEENAYRKVERDWLEMLADARAVLDVMVEDAQTQLLDAGFPILDDQSLKKNLPSLEMEALSRIHHQLFSYGLIEGSSSRTERVWRLKNGGPVWRLILAAEK